MSADDNPYRPPQAPETAGSVYNLIRYGGLRHHHLEDTLNQLARDAQRFVTYASLSSSDHFLVCESADRGMPASAKRPEYRVVPLPRRSARRWKELGCWSEFVRKYLRDFQTGWQFVALTSLGHAVFQATDLPSEWSPWAESRIVRIQPVWWRTLVGRSWITDVGQQVNDVAAPRYPFVIYLNKDYFLFGRPTTSNVISTRTYQMRMMDGWQKAVFQGLASICEPWLNQMAGQGWRLASHYQGAIFLFAQEDAEPEQDRVAT
jgi:hypothetical protein